MYVRMKVGIHAGEVLDITPAAARQLVANGDAEWPQWETPTEIEEEKPRNETRPKRRK
jgi:hypothetical protein